MCFYVIYQYSRNLLQVAIKDIFIFGANKGNLLPDKQVTPSYCKILLQTVSIFYLRVET